MSLPVSRLKSLSARKGAGKSIGVRAREVIIEILKAADEGKLPLTYNDLRARLPQYDGITKQALLEVIRGLHRDEFIVKDVGLQNRMLISPTLKAYQYFRMNS